MIERIYIDNIRSFVNFEWRPGPLAVILGANGTGKTVLFSILAAVQSLVSGDVSTQEILPVDSLTRWDAEPQQSRPDQTVEIDLRTTTPAAVAFARHARSRTVPADAPPSLTVGLAEFRKVL